MFADAQPDDGLLDVGVLTSEGPVQLVRAVARPSAAQKKSPFVRATQGRKVRVKLDRKIPYELDGGDRKKVKSFKVDVEAGAITVCVPPAARGEWSEMSTDMGNDLSRKARREGNELAGAKPLGWLARGGLSPAGSST